MMNCGVSSVGVGSGVRDGVRTPDSRSLRDWFSFIGLGSERQEEQQQQKGVSSNNYHCGSNEIGTVGKNRTPETINLNESIDMYNDDVFGGDDGDRDDVDNNANVSKVSEVESSISKQLSYVQCAGQPIISNSKKQNFHRRCHPSTCRMTSGMCVDCAHCFKHCVCGDEQGKLLLLPVTCDTPDCSHIVCTDCMRCHTHCTCYDSDPIHRNLLRGEDENSLVVAFSPPSIGTPTRHRHQSLLNMEMRKKERVGTKKNPKKTPTAAVVLVQQQLELSRRTHSLLSDDDDNNNNNNKDDHDDDNCVTTTGNERHMKNNNNQVSSYTRILSQDENNSDTNNYKFSSSNSSRFHDDVDDNGNNAYYAEKIVPPTQSTSTAPFTTYEGDNSIACPTRASASTAPHRNNYHQNRRTNNSAAARTTSSSWRHIGNRNRRRKRSI